LVVARGARAFTARECRDMERAAMPGIVMFRMNDSLTRWALVGLAILVTIVAVRLLIGLW
jgi:hypothetical protein